MNRFYGKNVSEFEHTAPDSVIEPKSPRELQDLLRERRSGALPLRVVSTGFNWGLGSASSVGPKSDLVSLHRMDRIREVNDDLGFAVIEAGVTQEQLSSALRSTRRYLNCTASTAKSSIVGNTLDRGVGLHGQRTEDLLGIEILLPDGRMGTIGWWPGQGSLAANPWGLGPSSLHLFSQSNLAIVTAATIRIRPRPSRREIITFTVSSKEMTTVVEQVRKLIRDDILSGVTKIYDQESSSLYGSRRGVTTVHTCIDGTPAITRIKKQEIWRALADVTPEELPADVVDRDPLMSAVVGLYHGDTFGSEDIVRNALKSETDTADEQGDGWIFALPFIPMRGEDVAKAVQLVRDGVTDSSARAGTTVNVLDHDTVDLVIAISFKRDTNGVQSAHRAFQRIVTGLVESGYMPYRVDTQHVRSDYEKNARGLDAFVAQSVKHGLDPDGVLASTRYVVGPPTG